MAPGLGFEPRITDSESVVMPLHYPGTLNHTKPLVYQILLASHQLVVFDVLSSITHPMKKILLIEDDSNITQLLNTALSSDYIVTCVGSIFEAYTVLENTTFDLLLIDRMLPDGDAIEVIQYVHDAMFQTKIIAISQLYQTAEKIKGLELGADDYLPKPFSLGELKLKVKKMLSYDKRKDSHQHYLQDLVFNPESGEVSLGYKISKLRKKESQILNCLFKYKNRVVSRNRLIDEVWSEQEILPTQTTLDVYIRRIRILLGNYGTNIVTKRGFGYMLSDG